MPNLFVKRKRYKGYVLDKVNGSKGGQKVWIFKNGHYITEKRKGGFSSAKRYIDQKKH